MADKRNTLRRKKRATTALEEKAGRMSWRTAMTPKSHVGETQGKKKKKEQYLLLVKRGGRVRGTAM